MPIPQPFSPREMSEMRPGCCFEIVPPLARGGGGGGGGGGIGRGGYPPPASEPSVMGTVLPRRPKGGNGRNTTLTLLVFRPLDPSLLEGEAAASWELRPLVSLISEARQYEACIRAPGVAFLDKIMNLKKSTHIRFEYSDDNDDSDSSGEGSWEEPMNDEAEEKKAEDDNDVVIWEPQSPLPADAEADADADTNVDIDDAVVPSLGFNLPPLNAAQERAASTFLGSDPGSVTLVQGPPGTGKTTFLTSVLCGALAGGRRVLVTAPTNRAVSVLANRYLDAVSAAIDPEEGGRGRRRRRRRRRPLLLRGSHGDEAGISGRSHRRGGQARRSSPSVRGGIGGRSRRRRRCRRRGLGQEPLLPASPPSPPVPPFYVRVRLGRDRRGRMSVSDGRSTEGSVEVDDDNSDGGEGKG